MARAGILFEEVRQAAEAMLAEGTNPTHARIREALGAGSFSTIGKHLHAWRQGLRVEGPVAPPPEGLQTAVGQIWRELDIAAKERVADAEESANQRVAEVEAACDARLADAQADAQARIEAAQEASQRAQAQARQDTEAAVSGWNAADARLLALQAQYDTAMRELAQAQAQSAALRERVAAAEKDAREQEARDAEALAGALAQVETLEVTLDAQREEAKEHAGEMSRERKAWACERDLARVAATAAQAEHAQLQGALDTLHAQHTQALTAHAEALASSRTEAEAARGRLATLSAGQDMERAELHRLRAAESVTLQALRDVQAQTHAQAQRYDAAAQARDADRNASIQKQLSALQKNILDALQAHR